MAINLAELLTHDLQLDPSAYAGQVILVTGAGRGIGLQTARAFALLGGKVVLAELSEAGRAAEEQIRAEGGEALYVQTDVADQASVAHLVEITHEHYGPVDVLVNNAIYIREAAVADMPIELWDQTIAVNLRGTFLTCKACLPEMLTRQHGTILNLISTDAMPGLSAYIASKQGITGFSQSLAQEVGSRGRARDPLRARDGGHARHSQRGRRAGAAPGNTARSISAFLAASRLHRLDARRTCRCGGRLSHTASRG